jgi:threonine dehydrogenase-like Zn-dependent dehydrogenase
MKAAMFKGANDVGIIETEKPTLKGNEVLIKVGACGVCGTDDLIFKGYYNASFPVILGHEYCGEIIDVGKNVSEFKLGDKVAVDPNIFCGKCFYCKRGQGNLCKKYNALGVTLNGGFAQYSTIPVSNVYLLNDEIDFVTGAMSEPLACCIRGIQMSKIKLGDIVVIIGHGGIGNLIMQLSRRSGASRVIIIEPLENRRKLALESGADLVLDPFNDDIKKAIRKIEKRRSRYCF